MQTLKEWAFTIFIVILLILAYGIAGNNDMKVYCMQHPGTCEQINK